MEKKQQVYFLRRTDGLIKIGFSLTFPARLRQLEKSHGELTVLKLISGDLRREKQLHHRFASDNEFGEWFRPTDTLMAFISDVEAGAGQDFKETDLRREWAAFEIEHLAECTKRANDFYSLCYGPRGETFNEVAGYIERTYRIPSRTFQRLCQGAFTTPSSALMERIRAAHVAERLAAIEELKSEVEDIHKTDIACANELNFMDDIEALTARLTTVREQLTQH